MVAPIRRGDGVIKLPTIQPKEEYSTVIILSQVYEIVTHESAEHGDAADRGFDWGDCPHTFRETVDLIRDGGFIHPSDSHGVPGWLSTEPCQDYRTGEYETKSIHPARDARSQRYWSKACKAAGITQ